MLTPIHMNSVITSAVSILYRISTPTSPIITPTHSIAIPISSITTPSSNYGNDFMHLWVMVLWLELARNGMICISSIQRLYSYDKIRLEFCSIGVSYVMGILPASLHQ